MNPLTPLHEWSGGCGPCLRASPISGCHLQVEDQIKESPDTTPIWCFMILGFNNYLLKSMIKSSSHPEVIFRDWNSLPASSLFLEQPLRSYLALFTNGSNSHTDKSTSLEGHRKSLFGRTNAGLHFSNANMEIIQFIWEIWIQCGQVSACCYSKAFPLFPLSGPVLGVGEESICPYLFSCGCSPRPPPPSWSLQDYA